MAGRRRHGQRKSQVSTKSQKMADQRRCSAGKAEQEKRDWFTAERRATNLESQVLDPQGRLNQASTQLKDAENERDDFAKEFERVKKEFQDQIIVVQTSATVPRR
ncbi:hypothetical protein MRX96_057860 [Rhipicephalus microplus]